jgi:ERCC4-type nuclease
VSPAEPPSLRALGEVSSIPETKGCDFLIFSAKGLVGVQRKRVDDLVASVHDGRFQREMAQLCSSDLHQAYLVVEGDWRFTVEGKSLAIRYGTWTRKSWHGIELSTQHLGIRVVRTDSLSDTAEWLEQVAAWTDKAEHHSLAVRPKTPRGAWEDPDRHFWLRVLQSFDGISAVTAGAIYDQAKADGIPLLEWVPDEAWFTGRVKGVGKGRAKVLVESLNGRKP